MEDGIPKTLGFPPPPAYYRLFDPTLQASASNVVTESAGDPSDNATAATTKGRRYPLQPPPPPPANTPVEVFMTIQEPSGNPWLDRPGDARDALGCAVDGAMREFRLIVKSLASGEHAAGPEGGPDEPSYVRGLGKEFEKDFFFFFCHHHRSTPSSWFSTYFIFPHPPFVLFFCSSFFIFLFLIARVYRGFSSQWR